MNKISHDELLERQKWPLQQKIEYSQIKIIEFYNHYNGQVYISFSGGKDSTVLLHLTRLIIPNIEAVFIDTGLEFPEIRDFVKNTENVIWIKPKMSFKEVVTKY